MIGIDILYPFQATVPFLYLLKTSENTFSGSIEVEYWAKMEMLENIFLGA